jgi:alkylation response protein AidB-like acyl-CoA dehydrogenase
LSPSIEKLSALIGDADKLPEGTEWAASFRQWFGQLHQMLPLHPQACAASDTFNAAAEVTRLVAANNLPLGLGLVMHLYPLCALRCVPLPWWTPAARRRSHLTDEIDGRRLILANAGSERAAGAHAPVTVTRAPDGIRIDGSFDYVSLAHVADIVLFSAPLGRGHVFCAADLHAESVTRGPSRFRGTMRLSDTCSLAFRAHQMAAEHFIEIPDGAAMGCMTLYQRSWFHLLLGEAYLARLDHLQHRWQLTRPVELVAHLNELALLREYALRLLDEARPDNMAALARVTAAFKLRVSWLAQSTAEKVRAHDENAATELGFIRLQPTPDARIVQSLFGAAA